MIAALNDEPAPHRRGRATDLQRTVAAVAVLEHWRGNLSGTRPAPASPPKIIARVPNKSRLQVLQLSLHRQPAHQIWRPCSFTLNCFRGATDSGLQIPYSRDVQVTRPDTSLCVRGHVLTAGPPEVCHRASPRAVFCQPSRLIFPACSRHGLA